MAFTWAPDHVDFLHATAPRRRRSHYAGANVPQPGDETARINVWLFRGAPPTDGRSVEVVVRSFTFTPLA
jgi:hypothetical protein